MTAISTKHPNLGGFSMDMHKATLINPPPAPPVPMPVYPWVVIIPPGVPVGELLLGKFTIGRVHTGLCFSDTLHGNDKGMLIPHIATWAIPPIETITVMLGSSTKHFLPSFGVQEKATMGAINIGQSGPIAISAPPGMMMVQQCQDANGVGFVLPIGTVFCLPTTRFVGFTLADLAAGVIGMVGDALAAAIGSKIGDFLTGSRFFSRVAGRVAPALARRLGASEAVATKVLEGVLGATLGHINNALQNWTGSPDSAEDKARRRMLTDVGVVTAPAGVGAAFGEMGNQVGNPPPNQVGRRPNIWE